MAQNKNFTNEKDDVNISQNYRNDCIQSNDEIFKRYNTSLSGLSSSEAAQRLSSYGLNEISQNKPKKWYHFLWQSLISPFNIILLFIVCILLYTDVYLSHPPSWANIIVILILVTVSTLLDFFEEYRSKVAAEKLKQLVATKTTVIRDGQTIDISIKELVKGDIVVLNAGSMIPADLRIIDSKDLYVNQSSLTGESESVRKGSIKNFKVEQTETLSDLDTICFMGTSVISGSGKSVVIKTGNDTYFGKVADTITKGKPKSSFEIGIQNISKLLIKFMLVLTPVVFLLNFWKHTPVQAFTFSVAIAICITPLLLPVILSSSLSKGAVKMSKKKTIVKKLDSIQSFGSMNILCTDKTGTLTEDKIVLEKYLDAHGDEDTSVLKQAFLNAYFQTGLRSNIDEAVIARAEKNDMLHFKDEFELIDEIPFDFSRRMLSVIVKDNDRKEMITKGAVEEILDICSQVYYKGETSPITNQIKENVKRISKNLNKDGLRVIAVCKKYDDSEKRKYSVEDEKNMIFTGFIGFLDPPKESAKSAIENLNKSGIRVIVLTGDNYEVTKCICEKVDIHTKDIITGAEIERLPDAGVQRLLRHNNIFVKLSPIQKARIVRLLKEAGNTVGYMGDGINDAPSLTNSDVGISVDTAVDIAKDSADIILLEKDLHVLLDGVQEGRKTFGNLMKYIKMATSFNFGEVLSVVIASIFLPFLPETPIQLLVEGLLYDFGQLTLPFDNVDTEYLRKPHSINLKSLKKFMLFMGPLSSIFDLIIFACLMFVFKLHTQDAALFQTIWFTYSIISNLFGMHIIRTAKAPFIESNASKMVYFSSIALCIVALIFPLTWLGTKIGLVPIPITFMPLLIGVPIIYCLVASVAKKIYIKKYGEWV